MLLALGKNDVMYGVICHVLVCEFLVQKVKRYQRIYLESSVHQYAIAHAGTISGISEIQN